ncbi:hypothetical protein ACEPAG_4683 [Sanghuangporus baumii]
MDLSTLPLPLDILSIICRHLDLKSIARLRQVSPALSHELSNDKQLWVHILERDVKRKRLPIPANLRDISEVTASSVESWIKHAIMLDRCYKTPENALSVSRLGNRKGPAVTWLKLILGRWCLVAAADDYESEMSLWEITSKGGPRRVAKIYLEAPVIDGRIDVSLGEIRCAVSVGTVQPYILILGIHLSPEAATFQQLARIKNAAHVRFFKADLLGFAVLEGDDTYPYLSNWKLGKTRCLRISRTTPGINCPFPIESCMDMSVHNGLIFTLHHTAVHVFTMQDISGANDNDCPRHITALTFQDEPIMYGQFVDGIDQPNEDKRSAALYVLYQHQDPDPSYILAPIFKQAYISSYSMPGQPDVFFMKESIMQQPPNVPLEGCPYLYQVGSSARTLFVATCLTQRTWRIPSVFFASLRVTGGCSDGYRVDVDDYRVFRSLNLPLLHLLSCVDFDDGSGLLVMGTVSGDVRVASVLPERIVKQDSVWYPLGIHSRDINRASCFSEMPPALHLPLFYDLRRKYGFYNPLPDDVVSRVTSRWSDARLGRIELSGWSNDWEKFDRVWDWIQPVSCWGPLDEDFMHVTDGIFMRMRLDALGDMIPLLYCHHEVVFRIGQRLFYSRTMDNDDDHEESMQHLLGFLGVLPMTYDEFLNRPADVLVPLSDSDVLTNLDSCSISHSLTWRTDAAFYAYKILEHYQTTPGPSIDVNDMETWANDDWDRNEHYVTKMRGIY